MFKSVRGQKGFTIIELVCVLVVVAVLAAYLVPKAIDISAEAAAAKTNELISAINTQEKLFWAEGRVKYPSYDAATLDNDIWSQMKGTNGILVSGSVVPVGGAAALLQTGTNVFDYGEISGISLDRTAATLSTPALWVPTP